MEQAIAYVDFAIINNAYTSKRKKSCYIKRLRYPRPLVLFVRSSSLSRGVKLTMLGATAEEGQSFAEITRPMRDIGLRQQLILVILLVK